ncbi:MAG TPA: glycoside hydrolase family 31 protein [Acidobacteriaceae bacterium]|jgi:alpha-glucosidase|nr:glycoside hydrolase family 31 protein [Acidobacteriaceae bacterium]
MFERPSFVLKALAGTFLFALLPVGVACQSVRSGLCSPGPIEQVKPLANGVELRTETVVAEVLALRDDVLRVRVSPTGQLPEDASWAALPSARHAAAAVTIENNANAVGFKTKAVQVEISRSDLSITVRDRSGRIIQEDARPVCFQGNAFRIFKRMPADEHYFGLGDKTGPLDRRGEAFDLWNTDAYRFQESTDPIYKSIPFFITFREGTAAGIFLDDTWRTSFDFGTESPDFYSFGAVNGPLDYYIFTGPTPRKVVEAYAWLTGKPPLPPLWVLGFQQSRYTYTPVEKLMDVADRLRVDKIPADALYLDIGFQEKNRPFTVDKTAFPDFAGTVATLTKLNFHLVVITDLHIAKLPGHGYVPYDSGMAQNQFVHNPDGSVFSGIVWPGPSVFPDFTRKATREWWGGLYRQFVSDGVAGFWNDMNEPSVFNTPNKTFPLDVIHRIDSDDFAKRTATHAEIHDVYGMENSRATFDGLRNLHPDERPFVLTRATYAGGQRYAATWTGDNSSTWNHLRMTAPMLENLGLSGFSFSGADVGGFAGTPPADLLTRWMEIAAFQPIDRDHTEIGTGAQEPWVGGPVQEDIRRRFLDERYRLLPYLYTLAEESSHIGLPMMRPIFLDYPKAATDGHPIDIDTGVGDEFLLGHDLLIAPSPYPEEPDAYTVEFPTADWYDYWTGKRVEDPPHAVAKVATGLPPSAADLVPLTTEIHPTLASLPVFVRGGAILPIEPLVQSTNEMPHGPLTLRIYAGPACRGSLYLDDGHTYAFQQGDFLRMSFTCQVSADTLAIRISRQGSYRAWWKDLRLEVYGWQPRKGIALKGGEPEPLSLQRSGEASVLNLPDSGGEIGLTLE